MGTTDLDLLNVLVASLAFGRCKFILILLSYRIYKDSGPQGSAIELPRVHCYDLSLIRKSTGLVGWATNAKGAKLMGISHGTDAFVEVGKPHALVRSVILTY